MKAIKILYWVIGIYCILVLFIKCMSLTGFQTGRTAGEGNWQKTLSLNYTGGHQDFLFPSDDGISTTELDDVRYRPFIESEFKYGVAERLDIGLRISNISLLGFQVKYQLLGDQKSGFAGAMVLEGGRVYRNWYFQIPLAFSWHPSKRSALYFSPRFIQQYVTEGVYDFAEEYDFLSYYGFNTGYFLGKKTKVGIDYGYFLMKGGWLGKGLGDGQKGLHTIGLGIQF